MIKLLNLVSIDHSMAFDTIDYKLLIAKIQYYSVRGIALDGLMSYLSNRLQCVNINKSNSISIHKMRCTTRVNSRTSSI